MTLCDAASISSHTVTNTILDYLKDPNNSAIADTMFTSTDSMQFQIAISGNKLYWGGSTYLD